MRRDPQSYGVGLRGQGSGFRTFMVRVQAGEPYRLGFRLQNLKGQGSGFSFKVGVQALELWGLTVRVQALERFLGWG